MSLKSEDRWRTSFPLDDTTTSPRCFRFNLRRSIVFLVLAVLQFGDDLLPRYSSSAAAAGEGGFSQFCVERSDGGSVGGVGGDARPVCRNGECYVVDQREVRCACYPFYFGERCEHVNATAASRVVIGSVVIFQWPRPPRLRGYSFRYQPLDRPPRTTLQLTSNGQPASSADSCPPTVGDPSRRCSAIRMRDGDVSVVVGNLEGGGITYRICIEDEQTWPGGVGAGWAAASTTVDLPVGGDAGGVLPPPDSCVLVVTQPDYDSLIGWGLVAMLTAVVILLMYSQKDKIELLYFSRPMASFYAYDLEEPGDESGVEAAAATGGSKEFKDDASNNRQGSCMNDVGTGSIV